MSPQKQPNIFDLFNKKCSELGRGLHLRENPTYTSIIPTHSSNISKFYYIENTHDNKTMYVLFEQVYIIFSFIRFFEVYKTQF